MIKKLLFIFSVSLLTVSAVSAQKASKNAQTILGIWENNDAGVNSTVTFNADGTGAMEKDKFKYTLTDSTINVKASEGKIEYKYEIKPEGLLIFGGDFEQPILFVKKK